jgi:hypothetical protein
MVYFINTAFIIFYNIANVWKMVREMFWNLKLHVRRSRVKRSRIHIIKNIKNGLLLVDVKGVFSSAINKYFRVMVSIEPFPVSTRSKT